MFLDIIMLSTYSKITLLDPSHSLDFGSYTVKYPRLFL